MKGTEGYGGEAERSERNEEGGLILGGGEDRWHHFCLRWERDSHLVDEGEALHVILGCIQVSEGAREGGGGATN